MVYYTSQSVSYINSPSYLRYHKKDASSIWNFKCGITKNTKRSGTRGLGGGEVQFVKVVDFVFQLFNLLITKPFSGAHFLHFPYLKIEFLKLTNRYDPLDYRVSCFQGFFPIGVSWGKFFINRCSVSI